MSNQLAKLLISSGTRGDVTRLPVSAHTALVCCDAESQRAAWL